jgi:hypothetical protein
MDVALKDRFPRIIEVKYLERDKEVELLMARTGIDKEDASNLVEIASQIREKSTGLSSSFTNSMSTRQLIAAAEDFMDGGVDSLTFTITNSFSPEGGTSSERASVLQLIQGKFGGVRSKAKSRLTK